METRDPNYLFKVLSMDNWEASQHQKEVSLSAEDVSFIHLAREDQLERILAKFWSNKSCFVILKLEVSKLKGSLVFEANPGGLNKYYHLYQGSIPLSAIVEVRVIQRQEV